MLALPRPRADILHPNQIHHHPHAGLFRRRHRRLDRLIRRVATHRHHLSALLMREVDVFSSAVHRLVIGQHWIIRIRPLELANGVHALRHNQRRAHFQPIDSGFDANAANRDRFFDSGKIQGDLNDRGSNLHGRGVYTSRGPHIH